MRANFRGLWLTGALFLAVLTTSGRAMPQSLSGELAESESGEEANESLASGDCLLSIDAGRRARDDGRREYYGAVAFTSPWGGCTGTPGPENEEEGGERPALREAPGAWDAPRELARDLATPASLAKTLDEPRPEVSDGRVYVVSPRLARDVVAAAWRASGLSQASLRLGEAADRARWSALLPELRLRGARGFDESARVDYEGEAAEDTRLTGSADVELEARLTWHLSELVFSGREPSIERLQGALVKERREVARVTLAALVRWQRAQSRLVSVSSAPEELADAMLDAAEAELELSVLTDGWFSAKRVRGAPWMVGRDESSRAEARESRGAPVSHAGPVRPSRTGGEPAPPGEPTPAMTGASPPVPPRAPTAGPDPGEGAAPGVNVQRNVGRDPKHAE